MVDRLLSVRFDPNVRIFANNLSVCFRASDITRQRESTLFVVSDAIIRECRERSSESLRSRFQIQ